MLSLSQMQKLNFFDAVNQFQFPRKVSDGQFEQEKIMKLSNANVNGAAALAAPATCRSFFGIAATLVAALGARRGINSALCEGRNRLSLNLRHSLRRSLLRQGRRHHWSLERGNLHNNPALTPTNIYRLSRPRNEEIVNRFRLNVILGKCWQTALSSGFGEGKKVRS